MDSEPKARETIHNAKPSAKIQRRQKDTQKMLLEIAALRRCREKKRCLRKIRMWRGGRERKGKKGRKRERTDGLYRCGEFFFRVVCEKKSEKCKKKKNWEWKAPEMDR